MWVFHPRIDVFVPAARKEPVTDGNHFQEVGLALVDGTQEVKIGHHRVATVTNEINYPAIFRPRQMMGLEKHGSAVTPIPRPRMHVRH